MTGQLGVEKMESVEMSEISNLLVISDLNAFQRYEGQTLGASPWHLITQAQIDAFAAITGDRQWIHTDIARAKNESPFGQTIAHGYLTLALIPMFVDQIFCVKNSSRTINSGIREFRFRTPVLSGARIRLVIGVKDLRDLPGGALRVTYTVSIEVEGDTKPACTGELIYAYFP